MPLDERNPDVAFGNRLSLALELHTVVLVFWPETDDERNGTAVLVDIGGRAFALTAGHCVNNYLDSNRRMLMPIHREGGRFVPEVVAFNSAFDGMHRDFGYLEFSAETRTALYASDRRPMSADRLRQIDTAHVRASGELVVLSGFPNELLSPIVNNERAARHFFFQTALAGARDLPTSPFSDAASKAGNIEVARMLTAMRPSTSVTPVGIAPAPDGWSGGGCWTYRNADDVAVDLVGIIFGGFPSEESSSIRIGDADYNFIYATPIREHLRMIASDRPETADEVRLLLE